MSTKATRVLNVLLVDDSEDDVVLALEALKSTPGLQVTHVARDGMHAIAYLRGLPLPGDRPDLILLDLSMPKLDGFQTLLVLQADESLRRIPVVVLSASDWEDDVLAPTVAGRRRTSGSRKASAILSRSFTGWKRIGSTPPDCLTGPEWRQAVGSRE